MSNCNDNIANRTRSKTHLEQMSLNLNLVRNANTNRNPIQTRNATTMRPSLSKISIPTQSISKPKSLAQSNSVRSNTLKEKQDDFPISQIKTIESYESNLQDQDQNNNLSQNINFETQLHSIQETDFNERIYTGQFSFNQEPSKQYEVPKDPSTESINKERLQTSTPNSELKSVKEAIFDTVTNHVKHLPKVNPQNGSQEKEKRKQPSITSPTFNNLNKKIELQFDETSRF